MFWIVLLQIIACLFHSAIADDGYVASPTGPQSAAEAQLASAALHGKYYGGDMRLPDGMNISNSGLRDERLRWPGYPGSARIPYVIDGSAAGFSSLILAGMKQYHDSTCIKFVPRKKERNYVRIINGNGCWSFLGRNGGRQDLSLGPGCHYIGLVVHELGHVVGLFHEHQRSDRDKYIKIFPKNVQNGQMHNFDRRDKSYEVTFNDYDYHSIMHYGSYAFSVQRDIRKTMEAKDGTPLLEPYEKPGFDQTDIEGIKKLYKC